MTSGQICRYYHSVTRRGSSFSHHSPLTSSTGQTDVTPLLF